MNNRVQAFFLNQNSGRRRVLNDDKSVSLFVQSLSVFIVLMAAVALLATIFSKYNDWKKKSAVKKQISGCGIKKNKRLTHQSSKVELAPLLPVIKSESKEEARASGVLPSHELDSQDKVLARLSSDVSHALITKRLTKLPILTVAASSSMAEVDLSFPAGRFTLAELENRRLITDSHCRHYPEDTFVIFTLGDRSVPRTVLAKSTQLAKKKKQGVVIFTQEERSQMQWDAKLKILGSNGKGDQRYLGRLQTTTMNGKTYGLLVFDSEPVSHAELKRQHKHHS